MRCTSPRCCGTIRWFSQGNYGSIKASDGHREYFFHATRVLGGGSLPDLVSPLGQEVEFDLERSLTFPDQLQAVGVSLAGRPPLPSGHKQSAVSTPPTATPQQLPTNSKPSAPAQRTPCGRTRGELDGLQKEYAPTRENPQPHPTYHEVFFKSCDAIPSHLAQAAIPIDSLVRCFECGMTIAQHQQPTDSGLLCVESALPWPPIYDPHAVGCFPEDPDSDELCELG